VHSSLNIFANHAPVWVFVLLGAIIGALALVLYFANSVGGGEKDYWYGDPSRQFYLNIPPKWQVLGFGMYGGYPPFGSYGPFGGFKNF
jgi:hypothetical protein